MIVLNEFFLCSGVFVVFCLFLRSELGQYIGVDP